MSGNEKYQLTVRNGRQRVWGFIADAPGSGKTTAAEYLVREHGFRVWSVGDLVKAEVAEMLAVHGLAYAEAQKEVYRPLLQAWALLRKEITGADYWLEPLDRAIEGCEGHLVVPDVRTLNELKLIKARGGLIIRLVRHSVRASGYESQLHGVRVDWQLDNRDTRSLAELYAQLDCLVEQHGTGSDS